MPRNGVETVISCALIPRFTLLAIVDGRRELLLQAMALAPGLGYARLALANVYIKMQEWSNAIAQLDAYLATNPRADSRIEVEAMRSKVVQRSQAKAR